MADYLRKILKEKRVLFFWVIAIIALLLILLGVFLYKFYFVWTNTNKYSIRNEFYSFSLKTPKGWIAEKNTIYSADYISGILSECNNDKAGRQALYEIGNFKFKDQKFPQDFGLAGKFNGNFPSGAILNVTINCVPKANLKNQIYGQENLKVGNENATEDYLNTLGFGKTKHISFLYNNIQYQFYEYVYISPSDKDKEEKIKSEYEKTFNKIISSFNFQ